MAQINNREVLKKIEKECFTSPGAEQVPNQLSNAVVPVIDASPEKVTNLVISNAGNGTIHTTDANKDTYITGFISDASNSTANQNSVSYLQVVPKGMAAIQISSLSFSTDLNLDFNEKVVSHTFTVPLLLERNSAIVSGATNVSVRRNIIFGYTVEPQ